jgi:hypothetical protein
VVATIGMVMNGVKVQSRLSLLGGIRFYLVDIDMFVEELCLFFVPIVSSIRSLSFYADVWFCPASRTVNLDPSRF